MLIIIRDNNWWLLMLLNTNLIIYDIALETV